MVEYEEVGCKSFEDFPIIICDGSDSNLVIFGTTATAIAADAAAAAAGPSE